MGTLRKILATSANRHRLGGKGNAGRRKYPLRKITGSDGEYEILECGHRGAFHLSVGADLFSTYQPANSRRCGNCYSEAQAKLNG